MGDQIGPSHQLVERPAQLPTQMPCHSRRRPREKQQGENAADRHQPYGARGKEAVSPRLLRRALQLPFVRIDRRPLRGTRVGRAGRGNRAFSGGSDAVPSGAVAEERQRSAYRSTPQ